MRRRYPQYDPNTPHCPICGNAYTKREHTCTKSSRQRRKAMDDAAGFALMDGPVAGPPSYVEDHPPTLGEALEEAAELRGESDDDEPKRADDIRPGYEWRNGRWLHREYDRPLFWMDEKGHLRKR